jgi:glycosyltransferase involved in cell wall biosynthesis
MTPLCLYTASFPYGLGEQFLETEIKYLAEHFDSIFIIPNNPTGTIRPTPANVKVLRQKPSPYTTLRGIKQLGKWVWPNIKELIKAPDKKYFLSNLFRTAHQANELYKLLEHFKLTKKTIHYTYWFNEQSTLLSILKSQNKISGYISRAHRFDLYEDRNTNGYIPFRSFQLQHVTKLFLISKHGLNYISSKYPQHQHKFHLAYLGVENPALFSYHPPKDESYHVVSCSRMVEIKRIHLIIKALSNIRSKKILWTHIGDGRLFEQIKHQAKTSLPSNIQYKFLGHIDNSEIFSFYRQANIDVFINVSSSEGLPVTIMEAISFGIPIIATDVGGTSEIVTNRTGILLNPNPKIEDITNAIITSFNSKSRSRECREDIHKYWGQHFDAKINYQKFTHELAQTNN